jgi:hypothetical protein
MQSPKRRVLRTKRWITSRKVLIYHLHKPVDLIIINVVITVIIIAFVFYRQVFTCREEE